ncbi:polysaccharide deacetylase family protein [Paenibacillus albus]|uniref:DUF7033 domain-containing protein n=1 Tax=Paenibacillus albus TaxID=2495582 RepID=A0A3Q8X9B0_9BACL|nr:polysaccharide deacetylase family protein [Paenibacillus albus]AZN43305.1 hypothetical protein EJC50_29160 [Paenibacillus albus]
MLLIKSPLTRKPERDYILDVLFHHFLGLSYEILYEEREDVEISLPGSNGVIRLADVLLRTEEDRWLTSRSMPREPIEHSVHARFGAVPILYGQRGRSGLYIEEGQDDCYCGIDILGSSFFMLTRYEELLANKRDARDRFPSESSIAYRANFLDRPIVNEYVEIFWELMKKRWPRIERKDRQASLVLSHDVDWPFYSFGKSPIRMLKDSLADIVKRRNYEASYLKARAAWRTRGGELIDDPFNTFRWLMTLSEKAGLRSAFYFITEETVAGLDGNYSVYNPEIQSLMREIHGRGHEIGLHPSYDTYNSPDRISRQFQILLDIAGKNGIRQERWGGRQHYLRWKGPETWQYWEEAGLDYDSTLGYADSPGFRCGVCYEYPVFNLLSREPLNLVEKPLIVMEQTVWKGSAGQTKEEAALEQIGSLYQQCRSFGGQFTLLWHNSEFVTNEQRTTYRKCLDQ